MSKKIIFLNILYGIFFLFVWVVGAEQDPLSAKDAGKLTIAVANSNDKGALISQIREMITDHLNQKQRFALVDPEKLMAFLKEKPSIRQSDIIITKDITSKEAEAFEEMEEIMKSLHVDFFVIGGFTFKNYPHEITEKGEVVYKDSQSICIRLISASDHHLLSGRFYTKGIGKSLWRASQCQESKISEAIITTPITSQRMVASEELSKLIFARNDFKIKVMKPRQEIAKIQGKINKIEKEMEEDKKKTTKQNFGLALLASGIKHEQIAVLKRERKKFENEIAQMRRQVNWTRLDELEKDIYARLRKDLLERDIQDIQEVEKKIRSLAEDIDQKINISGPVISAEDEDRVKISIGKNHGLSSKSRLQAYVDRASYSRLFGHSRTHKKLVTLETLEIEDDFCYAKVVKGKIKKLQKSLRKQNEKEKVRVRVVR